MNLLRALAVAYCAAAGTLALRFARRSRREGYSLAPRMRAVPLPEDFKLGVERACAVAGVFHYFLGAMMVAVMATPEQPSLWEAVVLAGLIAGVMASAATMFSIIWFNRPRFLVPPHMRHQPGTVTARLRERRRRGERRERQRKGQRKQRKQKRRKRG